MNCILVKYMKSLSIEMDKERVQGLIQEWCVILIQGKARAQLRYLTIPKIFVPRTGPGVEVFDRMFYEEQYEIQMSLCEELPEFIQMMFSEPDLDNDNWKVNDYIELYLNHYFLVITKIQEILE